MVSDPILDPRKPPSEAALAERIGEHYSAVLAAVNAIDTERSRIIFSWKFSKTSGWHLTYDRAKKRLFYLFPKPGNVLVRMVINEKGMSALRDQVGLTAQVRAQVNAPKKYPEGTLIELSASMALKESLITLLRIKIDH